MQVPGILGEVVLTGPDASSIVFASNNASVAEAKQFWSNQTSAPVEYVELSRAGQVLPADATLQTGEEISVMYSLSGAGPFGCQCQPNFDCQTNFPAFCAIGMCCNHCWCIHPEGIKAMFMAEQPICASHEMCCSADCGLLPSPACPYRPLAHSCLDAGFHKIWACELFCLQLKCGSPGWGPKCGPKFDFVTAFPDMCKIGICCDHCWLNNFCCEYWSNPFGSHCAACKCCCVKQTCGLALLGLAELFCAQCKCFHCSMHKNDEEGCSSHYM